MTYRRGNGVAASLLRGPKGRHKRPFGLALILVAVAAWTAAFSNGTAATKMTASVKPCRVIRSDGSTQQLRHGSFVFTVKDVSRTRYFALSGRGVKKATTARFVGTVRWRLQLAKGMYRFRCGSSRALRGVFSVG